MAIRHSSGCHSSRNIAKNSGVFTRPVKTGKPCCGGEAGDEQFVVARVRVFPEPHAGVGERLGRIVGGDADHLHPLGQRAGEQFLEHVVAAHEAAEHGHAGLRRRGGGVVDGGVSRKTQDSRAGKVSILFIVTSTLGNLRRARANRRANPPQLPGNRAVGRCGSSSVEDQVLFGPRFDPLTGRRGTVAGLAGGVPDASGSGSRPSFRQR